MKEKTKMIIKVLKDLDLYNFIILFDSVELFEDYCERLPKQETYEQYLNFFRKEPKEFYISGSFIWPSFFSLEYSILNTKWCDYLKNRKNEHSGIN